MATKPFAKPSKRDPGQRPGRPGIHRDPRLDTQDIRQLRQLERARPGQYERMPLNPSDRARTFKRISARRQSR